MGKEPQVERFAGLLGPRPQALQGQVARELSFSNYGSTLGHLGSLKCHRVGQPCGTGGAPITAWRGILSSGGIRGPRDQSVRQDDRLTFVSCCSEENPRPNTVLALLSAHCPNFCDVLVKVMLGVMVLLMITCRKEPEEEELNAGSDLGGAPSAHPRPTAAAPGASQHSLRRIRHTPIIRGPCKDPKTDSRSTIRSYSWRGKVCSKERLVSQTAVYFPQSSGAPIAYTGEPATPHTLGGAALRPFSSTWSPRVLHQRLGLTVPRQEGTAMLRPG